MKVSAQLRPQVLGDADPDLQNRFTALRQFEILSCNAAFGNDCADPANYREVFTSPGNAFRLTRHGRPRRTCRRGRSTSTRPSQRT
ncbi:hypothetical protein [Kibdelosporangium philippinense]|uniref:hypothetical protein n=1 Tax=Kibdelosporangium philippinense TaxID=211113 RepID=UPI00360DBC92